MAKKKPAVNKSQTIRDYAKANKNAPPKEIADALTKQGMKGISGQYVSTVLSKERSTGKGTKRKTTKKKAVRGTAKPSTVAFESVEAAADFISTVGSVDAAKEALSAAEKIVKKLQ